MPYKDKERQRQAQRTWCEKRRRAKGVKPRPFVAGAQKRPTPKTKAQRLQEKRERKLRERERKRIAREQERERKRIAREHGQHIKLRSKRVQPGFTFGYLTVLRRGRDGGSDTNGTVQWECRCACGTVKLVVHNSLVEQRTQSCGCLRTLVGRERLTGVAKPRSASGGRTYSPKLQLRKWNELFNDEGVPGRCVLTEKECEWAQDC